MAVNGDLTYALVDAGERKLIVAEDLVDELAAKFDTPLNVIGLLKGEALVGTTYARPVPNNAIPGDASVVLGLSLIHISEPTRP